ncbi:MAG: urea ABC transporter permease subunit UrtB [Gammaproteobacteria bacterium]|nr:urea ABC transporter permease subunit UrtB [Gammaproteobacteria bacterium]MDH5799781.1 urea ABC transporter permease subunit UrtB [Gammaproteobacteria bacterium]
MNTQLPIQLRIQLPTKRLRHLFALALTITAFIPTGALATDISPSNPSEAQNATTLEQLIPQLSDKSFKTKKNAIRQLENIDSPRVLPILQTFLDGDLYYLKSDGTVVIAKAESDKQRFTLYQALDNKNLGLYPKTDIKKIPTNNSLRKLLRTIIAGKQLNDSDAEVRYQAVKQILKGISSDDEPPLRRALIKEKDAVVKSLLETALALIESDSDDPTIMIKSINTLGESLETVAQSRLKRFLEKNSDGTFVEPSKEVVSAARSALNRINTRMDSYKLVETVFFGLSLGSVLLLAAIGLAITFGVMGVINMAHGELIMLGAYTTYTIQQLLPNYIGLALILSIPAAFIVSGLFGIAIERSVIRHLYGRPLETLLATFGISLILQQLVRSIYSPLNRSVESPSWMSGVWEINSALSLTFNRLYIIVFSLLVFAGLILVLKKTALGLQVRAVSQNRNMAKALGVRSDWVDALTFGLGAGIAGVAGVALSQLTNVGPNMGQAYIIDSFMVVVFGGVGNLWGTLVGALSLGVVNKFLEPYSGAVLAKILVLVFIILFIQKRPKGLFPQKGRAAEH